MREEPNYLYSWLRHPSMPLYNPQEDSDLLVRAVKAHAFGDILDMGSGSGIQALAAAEKAEVKRVLAVDIDEESLAYLGGRIENKKITVLKSDLFGNIDQKDSFDTIICNPPYLPQDPADEHQALYGGPQGYELIVRFLEQAKAHLKQGGIILLLFSSLTNKERVDQELKRLGYRSAELLMEAHFFERLYVYLIRRNDDA